MKTDKNLSDLFEKARIEAPDAPASKILDLLDSAKTSPFAGKSSLRPRRIKQKFNPLKIIIMISPIIILSSVLLILNNNSEEVTVKPEGNLQAGNPELLIKNQDKKEETLIKDSTYSIKPDQEKEKSIINSEESDNYTKTVDDQYDILGLSTAVFESLGFDFSKGGFSYTFKLDWEWVKFSFGIPGLDEIAPVRGLEISKDSLPTPIYLLTKLDRNNSSENQLKPKVLFWVSPLDSVIFGLPSDVAFDLCLPIRIEDPNISQELRDYIFWVFPNERFFQSLPDEISGSLRDEFYYQKQRLFPDDLSKIETSTIIKSDIAHVDKPSDLKNSSNNTKVEASEPSPDLKTEPVPCNYYSNLCATLPGVDFVNLYPNPATSKLNVDIVIENAKKIRFRVIDLGGRVLVDDGHVENFDQAGQFTHEIDISILSGGLYFMVITDEEGAKITKRFIKN